MKKNSKLTPVEWDIMDNIWKLGGAPSVRDIIEHGFPDGKKAYSTVSTMMNRLEKKGLLTRKKIGRVNFYKPTRLKEQILNNEINQIINMLFDGSSAKAAIYFLNSKGVSQQDFCKVKEIITQKLKQYEG